MALHQLLTLYLLKLLVLVCVCVCVFILFQLLVSSSCTTSVTYVRCSNQRSFVVSITRGFYQVPSSPFPNLSYFTSKDENSSRSLTGENEVLGISTKQIFLSLSDVAASLQRALFIDALERKPLG